MKGASLRIPVVLLAILFTVSATHGQEPSTIATPSVPKSDITLSSAPALVPPDSTKLEVVKSVHAAYPFDAVKNEMQGQVKLKVVVNEVGDVEDVQVLDGDEVFRRSAIDAAKKWKYKPFIKNGKPIRVAGVITMDFVFEGKTEDKKEEAPNSTGAAEPDPNLPRRVRVSQGVSQGLLIHKVQPTYPPEARMNRVRGTVLLQAVIGKDGAIKDLKVVTGPPELIQSAMGAVRQWRYKPYSIQGQPVEVETKITVNYQLY